MEIPETRYAETSDGLHLAYQEFGDGPPTVMIPALLSNVELAWDHELYRRVLEHDAKHLRVIHFDKRGIGCSDRFEAHPTLEQRIDDLTAVMDAVGLERAHLVGLSEGGLMAQLFAVRHPERVDRLVLINSAVGLGPQGIYSRDEARSIMQFFDEMLGTWGQHPKVMVERFMPSQVGNDSFVRWIGRLQRLAANPADMRRQVESVLALEAPADLGAITSPTLIAHTVGDRVVPVGAAHYLAEHIPDSELVLVDGDDHFLWIAPNWREPVDRMIAFLTGGRVGSGPERRFATVLFTDLVDSTARSAAEGDHGWHEVLDGHDRICSQVVTRLGGRVVKSTGDGILATFDTPSAGVSAALTLQRHLGAIGLPIRAGLHAGEIEVRDDGDISGMAVNFAARVEAAAAAGTVYASSTVRDLLLGSGTRFEDRGEHALKGIEGEWRLYELGA